MCRIFVFLRERSLTNKKILVLHQYRAKNPDIINECSGENLVLSIKDKKCRGGGTVPVPTKPPLRCAIML
jgi:hypothetical protein